MTLPPSGQNRHLLRVFVRLQLPTGTQLEPQCPCPTHERTAGRKQLAHRTGNVQDARLEEVAVVLLLLLQRFVARLEDIAGHSHVGEEFEILRVGKDGGATPGARSGVRIKVYGVLAHNWIGLEEDPANHDLAGLSGGPAVPLAVGIRSVAEHRGPECRVENVVHAADLPPVGRPLLFEPIADQQVT